MERRARYQRVRLVCRDMYRVISDRPDVDQALAVNELIETYLSRSVRLEMRALSYAERERYVGIRAAIYDLREKYWTPENWLELRLCKYISTGVFRLGHKLFSMVQNEDGAWKREVLIPAPQNLNRARQDHVYGPLPVPSPFRHPNAVAAAQTTLLSGQQFEVSEDGKGCSIDPIVAAQAAVDKARQNKNYDTSRPLRVQTLADGVGYFRGGRMATRVGVRIVNLCRAWNSKYYFSNVSLFMGNDHYQELATYLCKFWMRLQRWAPDYPSWKGRGRQSAVQLFPLHHRNYHRMRTLRGGDCGRGGCGLCQCFQWPRVPPLQKGVLLLLRASQNGLVQPG